MIVEGVIFALFHALRKTPCALQTLQSLSKALVPDTSAISPPSFIFLLAGLVFAAELCRFVVLPGINCAMYTPKCLILHHSRLGPGFLGATHPPAVVGRQLCRWTLEHQNDFSPRSWRISGFPSSQETTSLGP